MKIIRTILLSLIIIDILSCVNKAGNHKAQNDINSLAVKSKLSLQSYMEKDSVYQGEPAPYHVELKNESLDTFVILEPPRLTFLPSPGWEKVEDFIPFRYTGPEWSNLYPGETRDCGGSDISGFKEIPLGKSILIFQLEIRLKNKKDTLTLIDSLLINVFPSRLKK